MKRIALASVVWLLAACSGAPLSPPAPPAPTGSGGSSGTEPQPPNPPNPPLPPATDLVVHEWGTFTSVQSSAGVLMQGMHHEEEALPPFVYGRAGLMAPGMTAAALGGKSLESMPMGVTQKLETPVLYFYGSTATDVRVRVDFPQGVISEWYPNAATFGPALGSVIVPARGFMEWRAALSPAISPTEFPAVAPEDIWAPSRRVSSVPLAVGAEREQFIFYRGLGAFQMPLSVEVDAAGLISVRNNSSDTSPAVFLLRVHELGGAIMELGSLPGGGSTPGVPSPIGGKEHNLDVYVADAQARIARALEATGLYPDEARAMVETWSRSYFKSFGLRILYVVPRAWTDGLLPLTVEPAPTALVRTLVGRVELLSPSEERDLVTMVTAAAAQAVPPATIIAQLGRLAEPKLRRTLELLTDPAARTWCQSAISTAAMTP